MSNTYNIKVRNKAKRKINLYENENGKYVYSSVDDERNKLLDVLTTNGSRYGNKRKYEAGMKICKRRTTRKKQKKEDNKEILLQIQ